MASPIRPTGLGMFSGIDPKLVDQLIEVEKIPIEKAKLRKAALTQEKDEYAKLRDFIGGLDQATNALRDLSTFTKMKVDSSHPDIVEGLVQSFALPGAYEFEVRGLAKTEKELAYGYPDKDQTPVGFGYMYIEREDMEGAEIVVEPGTSLEQVAQQINDADAGVKALVINTKYQPDPFRLLVISEKSGKEAKVFLDEDTTSLEFKEQVTGRNLDVLFEDVPITDDDNILEELLPGVQFFLKRSEPGTRVQISINYDIDGTVAGIKNFVEQYNQIASFVHRQFAIDPQTNRAGLLSSDSSIKTVLRQLQSSIGVPAQNNGKFSTLAEVGISTNPKDGTLSMDEGKVRQSLAEDYESVAKLFVRSKTGAGVAERVAQNIRGFRASGGGILTTRMQGYETLTKNQDKDIERKTAQMEQKEAQIRTKFSNLENRMAGLKSQGDFLKQRFGGDGGGG